MSSRNSGLAIILIIGLLISPFLSGSVLAQGDLINVVQWSISEGGNDHWYGVLPVSQLYESHHLAASQLTHDGSQGYLATVNSQAEDAFIRETILDTNTVPNGIYFAGGQTSCGMLDWTTNEQVTYLNWAPWVNTRFGKYLVVSTLNNPQNHGAWALEQDRQHWAVVEFGAPDLSLVPDSIINLTQWTVTEGGNDHWYAIVAKTMPWKQHVSYARTLVHDTAHGYLATVLSAAENQFIADQVINGVIPNAIANEFYIGGERSPLLGIHWLTDESSGYRHWSGSEPSGDGTGLAMWGIGYGSALGMWNDVPTDTASNGCHHMLWSVVEWGTLDSSFHGDELLQLVQWPASAGGNDHWYGVLAVAQSYDLNKAAARTFAQGPDTGYLATITSAAENDFVVTQVLVNFESTPGDQIYLGGQINCGIMGWETGETAPYFNWDSSVVSRTGGQVLMQTGNDPSKLGKWRSESESFAFALVEFGPLSTTPPGSELLNLVQWPSSEGGNDHWYAVIAKTMPWTHHVNYARTLMHDTAYGYLATIRSPQENRFIVDHVVAGLMPNAVTDEYYLGGEIELAHDGVRWLTGEVANYNNWDVGEPNNDAEIGVAMWGPNSGHTVGTWNNVPTDTLGTDCFHMLWSVVEWGPPDSITNPTGLIHLVQWPTSQGGNDHWYGILANPDTWTNHHAQAQLLTQENLSGYLATVTSAQEDQFILQSVLGTLGPDSLNDTYFLGGRRDCSQFEWEGGEPFGYSNWEVQEQKWVISYIFMHSPLYTGHTPGTWNADEYKSLIWRPAIVEFGPLDTRTLDTIASLKQWTAAQGGNDHWYAAINSAQTWVSQYERARTLVHNGEHGYLATITSIGENDFIVDSVMGDLFPNAIVDEFYLGGRRPAKDSAFQWLTGEAWILQNWDLPEPSGDGPAIAIWGKTSGRRTGSWNDVPEDTLGIDCYHQIYAIVEWGGVDPSAHQIALGNVDCDPANRIDISDLTKLIDYTYINRSRWNFLWCPDAANIDTDPNHQIDIADITKIIDYLYISFTPLGGYR